ncbi:MAG: Gfo/Idh/MocA family oxidoreductase [Planctomycetales bacterium]|nr:Gfo/Idh/MocA family oxidoreductase [Planctomycetales bacterium]
MSQLTRRQFCRDAALPVVASSIVALTRTDAQAAPSERIRVGVIGAGGRALSLIDTFAANPTAEVVAIADLDANRLPLGLKRAEAAQGKLPRAESDFRRLIDDRTLDAIVVGTPDHWHAIPTILACQAGKDVYVEKPDSHNIVEGQRMVAAAGKYRRVVQMGSQHRSTQRLQSAIDFVATGVLGRCIVAKAWESTRQGPIGYPADAPVPAGVDYDMWLGPAPLRPFNINRFHGRWRWFHDYGTGDLGNDGVHRLDMAVALLNAACRAQHEPEIRFPNTIFATGGKMYFDDAQEFPDTMQVSYEFHSANPRHTKLLTYEMRIWAPYPYLGQGEGAAIFGDRGYLIIGNQSWAAFHPNGEKITEQTGDSHERPHVQNFLDCIKSRKTPACDLATIGHPASVLCHAGNLSARLGRSLRFDATTETYIDDAQANQLRGRTEYRRPWALPEVS